MTYRRIGLAAVILALAIPSAALAAGTADYSTPGAYWFTVPHYGSMTVGVWGGGGGGSGYGAGGTGGWSQFDYYGGGPFAYGGEGGPGAASGCPNSGNGGAGGNAYNGSGNYAGGAGAGQYPGCGGGWTFWSGWLGLSGGAGAYGGVGGYGDTAGYGGSTGGAGGAPGGGGGGGALTNGGFYVPGGGGGGGGAYSLRSYSIGELTPGSSVLIYVGAGGAGGTSFIGDMGQEFTAGGNGAAGDVYISWSNPPAATCAVSLSPNPINQGDSSYLSWTSSYADSWVYISNIGYVGASGATYVAPSATTDYACYARGSGGDSGWQSSVLTVNQSCVFNSATVPHGSSVTAYEASSVPYGGSCSSQTRTCNNGTLSGSYTYASCSVMPPANCTLDGQTVAHGASQTFYSQQTAPVGGMCSAVSISRTCNNGTLSGSASYQYASCTCAPIYSCSGQQIQYTDASCTTTDVGAACGAGSRCVPGQSTCEFDPMTFTSFPATGSTGPFTASGHLQVRPVFIRSSNSARLYWSVSNAQTCTVSGSNGDSWNAVSSPAAGNNSSPLNAGTTFTLNCTAVAGASPANLTETVNVVPAPVYEER